MPLPLDFDPAQYLDLNPDLAAAKCEPSSHYINHGEKEGRPYLISHIPVVGNHSIGLPLGYDPGDERAVRVGIFAHVFYPEMVGDMMTYLRNIPAPADLLITTVSDEKLAEIKSVMGEWNRGDVHFKVVPNRGRDIAPKLIAFADRYAHYRLVLHVHSKKSPHHPYLNTWRQFLFQNLCGSPQTVRGVFEMFDTSPHLGMAVPQHVEFLRRWVSWGDNYDMCDALGKKIGVDISTIREIDFAAGSMFWARPQALRPLLDLALHFGDFPEEAGQEDATLAHAIERMYLVACEASGMDWLKISDPSLYPYSEITRPGSREELHALMDKTTVRLLP